MNTVVEIVVAIKFAAIIKTVVMLLAVKEEVVGAIIKMLVKNAEMAKLFPSVQMVKLVVIACVITQRSVRNVKEVK